MLIITLKYCNKWWNKLIFNDDIKLFNGQSIIVSSDFYRSYRGDITMIKFVHLILLALTVEVVRVKLRVELSDWEERENCSVCHSTKQWVYYNFVLVWMCIWTIVSFIIIFMLMMTNYNAVFILTFASTFHHLHI